MCGILGVINFDQRPVDGERLKKAARMMRHRGPDDEGSWTDGPVGLAHQRLAILDLSALGRQPMFNRNGSAGIIYNGECYNFQDLRKDLIAKGYSFRSRTDTEVILYGFQEYGIDFVGQMNGMFAIGIWFKEKKELWLLRDRLGIKPLYYFQDQDRFIFSSEIKPILSLGVPAELEHTQVSSYFSLRYCPGEKTLFKNIFKLPPGCFLKVKLSGQVDQQKYWDLLNCSRIEPLSEAKAQEKFFYLFQDSVRLTQIADVPVGAFLSGGIDSSAIVASMKRNSANIETFTFSMGSDIDESAEAARIAQELNVKNTIIHLQKNDYEYYPKALWHLEEPLGDSIIAPTYLLAKTASNKVKVVELGEGADEILGGYVHQLAMTYGDMIGKTLPSFVRKGVAKGIQWLPHDFLNKLFPYPAQLGKSGINKIADYMANIQSPMKAYFDLVGVFNEEEKKRIFTSDFYQSYVRSKNPSDGFSSFFNTLSNPVFQNRLLQLDLRFWNADYSLLRMDKLTMAHSLEARVPYLDHRLVEFCLSLPRKFKTKNFKQKILLRKALAGKGMLPQNRLNAPKKAFYLPIEKCFDHQFEQYIRDILLDEKTKKRGILNVVSLKNMLSFSKGELVSNKQLMVLLVFELWMRTFIDNNW